MRLKNNSGYFCLVLPLMPSRLVLSASIALLTSPMRYEMLCLRFGLLTLAVGVLGLGAWQLRAPARAADSGKKPAAKAPDQAAIDRTREQVKMLDDLYKTAVVKITKVY